MSISCKISMLLAEGRQKMKHFLSNAHYCNPTRSMKENKKRRQDAMKAANDERVDTLERALKKAFKTRKGPKTTKNHFGPRTTKIYIGPISFSCFRFSGL